MNATHSGSIARRLAALALALAVAGPLALGDAPRAAADASQWMRAQPHWWDQSGGWRKHALRHSQWPSQWHRHRHQHDFGGFHRCFGGCGPRIVIGGSGVFFASPGFFVNPGFVVRQPVFIVRRPAFAIQPPRFVVVRPSFVARQKAFFARHPSLRIGQPHWHKPWEHKPWTHGSWSHKPSGAGGVRVLAPGMN